MKKSYGWKIPPILILTIFLLMPITYAQTYQNEPDGFRDLKWGVSITNIRGYMEYVKSSPLAEFDYYVRTNDELKVGNATIKKIQYAFFKHKLCSVSLFTNGHLNWNNLKSATFSKFGNPTKIDIPNTTNRYMYSEQYNWHGEKTYISLEYNAVTQESRLYMSSYAVVPEKYIKNYSTDGF